MKFSRYFLKENKDFGRITRFGQTFFDEGLKIKWLKNNLDYFRFGLIVSLRIDKRATQRNKIKRRLRAIFRELSEKIAPSYDFVIIARPAIRTLDYHSLKEIIVNFLKRNKLTRLNFCI